MGTFIQKSNKVHVAMILDESGSMAPQWDDTIGGANTYFENLKKDSEVDYSISITKFDTVYTTLATNVPITEVPLIDKRNYSPRGMTALYDAVGRTLQSLESVVQDNEKAMVVIITDGAENSSREHTHATIRPWIERLQAKGNWTFVYLGAVEDAWANASQMGLNIGNVASYSKLKTREVFASMSLGTQNYAKSADRATQAFYQTSGVTWDGVEPEDEKKP